MTIRARIRARWLVYAASMLCTPPQLARALPAGPGAASCGPSPIGSTCGGQGVATLGRVGADVGAGNPIDVMTGNKFQREEDMPPFPGELGIEVIRYYNSLDRSTGSVGAGWRLSYDTELFVGTESIQVLEADGGRLTFARDARSPRSCVTKDPAKGRIEILDGDAEPRYLWIWPDGRRLEFNSRGKLRRVVSRSGAFVQLDRGVRGELLRVIDSHGRMLALHYPARGAGFQGVSSIDTPLGRIDYAYNDASQSAGFGNLTGVRQFGAARRSYFYEPARQAGHPHALTGIAVAARGEWQRISTYAYAPDGSAVMSQHGSDRIRISRSGMPGSLAAPAVAIATDATGRVTRYEFALLNGENRLLGMTPGCADCRSIRYAYDPLGRVIVAGDMRSTRDALGRIIRIEGPSIAQGKVHSFEYLYAGGSDQPSARIERGYAPAAGSGTPRSDDIERRSSYGYDSSGRLVRIDGPLPGGTDTVRFRYDARGRLLERIEPGARTTRFEYDAWSRLTVLRSPEHTFRYEYDSFSRIAAIDRDGRFERYAYDAEGRIERVTTPTGETLSYRYDAGSGVVREIVDAAGRKISLERADDASIASSSFQAASGELVLRHAAAKPPAPNSVGAMAFASAVQGVVEVDAFDQPVSYVDSRRVRSGYAYDDFGRLRRIESSDAGDTRLDYDASNHLTAKLTPRSSIHYLRDDAGRVVQKRSADGVTKIEYAQNGKPRRIRFPGGEERFAYDARARLIEHTRVLGGHKYTTHFEHDEQGRLIGETLPDDHSLTYVYGRAPGVGAGLLNRIDWRAPSGVEPLVSQLGSDPDPAHRSMRLLGQTTVHRDLDTRGRLARMGAPAIWQERFTYVGAAPDPSGAAIESFAGRENFALQFDGQRRLIRRAGAGDHATFLRYDAGENLRARSGAEDANFSFAPDSNRLLALRVSGARPSDLTFGYSIGGATVRAGARSYDWDSEGRLSGVREHGHLIASYSYNAMNERIRKTVYENGRASTTWYLYERSKVIGEVDSAGRVMRTYVWLDDMPVALFEGGSVSAVITDAALAPRALVDTRGHASSASSRLNLRGSNQYLDRESGLLYNGERYLDPNTGRYLSPDPLGVAGGANPYIFASSNSLARIDVMGLRPQPIADESVADWTLDQKLSFVFRSAADQIQDHDLAQALRELVAPTAIATTAAIFSTWAVAQFTPYAWAADIAAAGIGSLFIGGAVWDVIQTSYRVARGFSSAKCASDLEQTSADLSLGLSRAAAALAAGIATGTAGSRVARLLRTTFERDLGAVNGSRTRAAINENYYGRFDPDRGPYAGSQANREWIARQRQAGLSDAHPPWSTTRSVQDTWLNPGDTIYIIQRPGGRPGGWGTLERYSSIEEARARLAILYQFKRSEEPLVMQEYVVKSAIPAREGFSGPQVSGWPASETYRGGGQQVQFLLEMTENNWRQYLAAVDSTTP